MLIPNFSKYSFIDKYRLEDWRRREREVANEVAFPDEVDTPKDIPARQRFQRYRGLRSFRTSPWDPYENLPLDYAKIFQFEDYRRTERVVRRKSEEETENIVDVRDLDSQCEFMNLQQ